MIKTNKIGAVVVLYNPSKKEVLENIESFSSLVGKIFIIDNSDKASDINENTFSRFLNADYINNQSNLGIAAALNIGARLAIKDNCNWLLTMDQDSRVTVDMITMMLKAIDKYSNIGMISPVHAGKTIAAITNKPDFEEVDSAMTSGNLLYLEAFITVGPFEEKLFIDYVDHEYCFRLKMNGFKIILANKAILEHNLGRIAKHKLGLITTNHNFIRRYYMTRNRLWIREKYKNDFPAFFRHDYPAMWKELVKILLYEKDKLKKIRAFFLGVYHFKINKFGKLN